MDVININRKLDSFNDYWSPKVIGELNGQYIKLVKIKGEFTWHKHDNEDECFMVTKGEMIMKFRDTEKIIKEGELIIVPKGTEHLPTSNVETHVLLFEPKTTINTGDKVTEYTRLNLDKI